MDEQIIFCDGFEVVPSPEINDLILYECDQSLTNSEVTTDEEDTIFSGGDSSPGLAAEEDSSGDKPLSFYIVKQPVYDNPEIKAKIDEANQEIFRCNELRINVLSAKKSELAEVSSLYTQMESLVPQSEGYRMVIEEKKKEFDTLLEALRNLRCTTSDQLCFTKEELDHLSYIAQYQIEYGSIGLEEEDWMLKETEKPDGIILSEKEASINRVKSMALELNEVKNELDAITWKINDLSEKLWKSQNNIRVLDLEKAHILEQRDRFYARIKMLRIQRDKGNAAFFQSLSVMCKAKELAASGNVRELEVFASSEVDRFMTHWNDDKAFREDYVRRISHSLCERELNEDGRIKDADLQIFWEKKVPVKTMKRSEKVHKTDREDSSSNSSQDGNVITDKRKKETKSDVIVYEEPKKIEEVIDEETLKERKREEQLDKARLAMERKRKRQEKAAAKAAIRAQKEAEKKLKAIILSCSHFFNECEKKAKKKAAANSTSPSESDQVMNDEKVKSLAVSGKEKHQKERLLFPKQRSFRYKHRGSGTEALPKAILNRRKARRYWVWGLSSASLAVALVLVVLLLR
ncbi:unnamed protein product [Arabidopsis thaliana]|uniref:Uncharacterized protein n=1 Tax=Arabidopsis thaliana TaxID=3702 RepID=A0A5S9Y8Q8_ARATH|nr:unnamed protein product [Arabidopsis thaliana]